MFHCLTKDGRVCPKIFSIDNQLFRESALEELETREGAGALFVHSTIESVWRFFFFFFFIILLMLVGYDRLYQGTLDCPTDWSIQDGG